MVHVFLLISLFSNLNTPSEVSDQPDSEVAKVTSFVEVRFDKAPLVIVGDPVLFNGAVIGNISKIEYDESKKGLTNVSVRLNNEGIPMGDSLVALVGSVKTASGDKGSKRKNSSLNSSNRSFLEILSLKAGEVGKNGEPKVLKGFTSFQEFWASKSAM
jgi:hypothetical protein